MLEVLFFIIFYIIVFLSYKFFGFEVTVIVLLAVLVFNEKN